MPKIREKRKSLATEYKEMTDKYESVKALRCAISLKMHNIPCIVAGVFTAYSFLSGLKQAILIDFTINQRVFSGQFSSEPIDYSPIGRMLLVGSISTLLCGITYSNGVEFQRRRLRHLNHNQFAEKLVALAPDMGLTAEDVLNSSLNEVYPHLENLEERLSTKRTNNKNNLLAKRFLETSVQLNKSGIQILGIYKHKHKIQSQHPAALIHTLEYLGADDIAHEFKRGSKPK